VWCVGGGIQNLELMTKERMGVGGWVAQRVAV